MEIPLDFSFSQNNLQDFLDCPRRFELRHLHNLRWPAVASEPILEIERHLELGEHFHQMIQQHQLGIPPDIIENSISADKLLSWWQNYLSNPLKDLPSQRIPECYLQTHHEGYHIVAKFDLLALQPNEKAVIVDWKTNRKRPARRNLQNRAQTQIYPFMLVQAAADKNSGITLLPEQISMVYWFSEQPDNPEIFQYSPGQYEEDCRTISSWFSQIRTMLTTCFPLTVDERRCRYCNYRSLCERGVIAGEWDEAEEESLPDNSLDIDFEQIAEIHL